MIWTQWSDLAIPAGLEHLPTNGVHPTPDQLEKVSFYVPLYMGGKAAIEQIPLMKNLQVVQSPNAGFDDVLQLLPDGVTLCNASGVHDASTAELAVGLTIAARRGFATFASNKEKGKWVHTRNTALADSRVGIIGYGNIGAHIAKQLSNFSVEIIPFTRSGSNGSKKMNEFDSLLPTLDVIILIVPLTDETRHLMNAKRLSAMKNGATLINVARGAVVDTDALVKELHTGRITAGLDVTDPEPLPEGHALWSAPNVIISPHVGGDTTAFEPRGRALVESQLKRFADGIPLINCVAGPAR